MNQHHNDISASQPVTIRDAYRGIDDILIEQEQAFDLATGLSDLMARIDRFEAGQHNDNTYEERTNLLLLCEVHHRTAVMRQRNSWLGVALVTVFSAMASVLVVLLPHLTLPAIGALVVVNLCATVSVVLVTRWSVVSVQRDGLNGLRDSRPLMDHRPSDVPKDNRRGYVPDDGGQRSDLEAGRPHEVGRKPEAVEVRVRSMMSTAAWVALTVAFGLGSLPAVVGKLAPILVFAGVIAVPLLIVGIPIVVSLASQTASRRAAALNILMLLLGRQN